MQSDQRGTEAPRRVGAAFRLQRRERLPAATVFRCWLAADPSSQQHQTRFYNPVAFHAYLELTLACCDEPEVDDILKEVHYM